MKRAAGKKQCLSAAPDQAPLWSDAETPLAYNLINRRRSMIRRLDHLLEDATNEQFHEAAVVLRDALERLRLALVKDTLAPQGAFIEPDAQRGQAVQAPTRALYRLNP